MKSNRSDCNARPAIQSTSESALEPPSDDALAARLDSVHRVLYLLFNEGYSASDGETAIRTDLCEEAARLCHLLCSQRRFSSPATHAADGPLMLFSRGRLNKQSGRFRPAHGGAGSEPMGLGTDPAAQEFLNQSAEGTVISPYHLEAAIAYYHCTSKSYAETDWPAILRLYDA